MSKSSLDIPAMVEAWRSLVGTPFVHQGRSEILGLDCIGTLLHGWRAGGWQPIDAEFALHTGYKRIPDSNLLTRSIDVETYRVSLDEVQPGDAILFAWEYMDELPRHVAAVSEVWEDTRFRRVRIIHTHWQLGRVCEHLLDDLWKSRIVSCHRIKGI